MRKSAPTITSLKEAIARIDGTRERLAVQNGQDRLRFGIPPIEAITGGGIALNDMHEIRCSLSRDIGCAFGFLLGLLSRLDETRPIAWICEPSTVADTGKLFPDGLSYFGLESSRMFHITPLHLADAFWASGEAARTGGVSAIIFHIKGNPGTFDLSVSRKLALRAQASGTPLFILRQAGEEEASSAATRWHVSPAPSLPDETYHKGLGHMRLRLTLEKNRNGQLGQWLVAWNPKTRSFENAAKSPANTNSRMPLYPSANRSYRPQEMGKIMAVK
ncbi:MAG: hypothetical protein AAF478_06125 [Pseudomonadota bacterium]